MNAPGRAVLRTMASTYRPDRKRKLPAMLAALAVQAALAYALIAGLAGDVAGEVRRRLEVLAIPARPNPPPPRPAPPERAAAAAPREAAGAAAPVARAAQVVAPRPPLVLAPPPPFVTATVAGSGEQASPGAGRSGDGPGAGTGGQGSGGGGEGDAGAGGGRGAERIGGGLRDADYPAAAGSVRAAGTVFVRFRVGRDGRARGCEVTRSSGSEVLDQTTCRLIEKRFRYRPAMDAEGRPLETVETTNFTWGTRVR